jgi:hypothetical protein
MREEMEEDHSSVTRILSKITNLPSEQIKPCLHSMMESLIELRELPFYARVTPDEWSQAFTEWVESHRSLDLPYLSDDAISRESLYGEHG